MFDVFRRHQKKWLAALTIMAMIAFSFPAFFKGADPVEIQKAQVVDTIYGQKVTNMAIRQLRDERQIANSFLLQSRAIVGDPFAIRFPEFVVEQFGFGAGRDDEEIKDAIRLAHKADQLGVRVTDEMIGAWIKEVTDGKLTNEQFMAVVRVLPREITPQILYGILRKQLRIRHVRQLALGGRFGIGSALVTPYEVWEFYQRLNDKVALETVALAVADFADQVGDPGDAELRRLHERYVGQFPDPASPEFGFKEPQKVQLQYAFASLDTFALALAPEVSDGDVHEYYEANKERYRIYPSAPKTETEAPAMEPAQEPEDSPATPEDSSDAGGRTDKGTQEGREEPGPKESAAPEATKESGEPSKSSERPPQGPPGEDRCGMGQEEPRDAPPAPEAARPQPAGEPAAAKRSQDDPAGSPDEKPGRSDPPAGSDEPAQPSEKPEEATEGGEPPKEEAPQYRPLEEVALEIRERLTRDKARQELLNRVEEVQKLVNEFAEGVYLPTKMDFEDRQETKEGKEIGASFDPPPPPDLARQVEALDLNFEQTELLPVARLSSIPTLADARELTSGLSGRAISEVMESADLYEPREFRDFKDTYVLAWKIADRPAREPAFEEIRDQVLAAYRTIEARPLAEKQAEAIAQAVREAKGDFSNLPDLDASRVTSVPMLPLWSSAPQFSPDTMRPVAEVRATEIPGIREPGEEFRKRVFALGVGEVAVAANQPQDTYYVVRLREREEASLESFAEERTVVEGQLQRLRIREMMLEWLENLREDSKADSRSASARI